MRNDVPYGGLGGTQGCVELDQSYEEDRIRDIRTNPT